MKFLAVALLWCVCATPAVAAQWVVDQTKSRLGFSVQWSGEPFTATFRKWNAAISFDPADLSHAHIRADIDLASESSDTPDNDDGLKGPEGFSIVQFPTARFESSTIVAKGREAYVATGPLSLHSVTRAVRLPFTLHIEGNVARVRARVEVLRTDFGLGTGEWAGETPISHRVSIDLALIATKAP